MIAFDARGLAGASPLDDDTRHSPAGEVDREAQTHRASPDNQHLSRESFAQISYTVSCLTWDESVRYLAFDVHDADGSSMRR
jgi:hypothetical protein